MFHIIILTILIMMPRLLFRWYCMKPQTLLISILNLNQTLIIFLIILLTMVEPYWGYITLKELRDILLPTEIQVFGRQLKKLGALRQMVHQMLFSPGWIPLEL